MNIYILFIIFQALLPNIFPSSTPTNTLTTYCSALKRNDYQTAYNQFSSNNNFENETKFTSTMALSDTMFGGLTGCDVLSVNENDSTGIANGDVWLQYGDGSTITLNARLVNKNGSWKITSMS